MARNKEPERPIKAAVSMPPEKAAKLLQSQIDEITRLSDLPRENDDFMPWREKTLSILRLVFGEPSGEIDRFQRVNFKPRSYYFGMPESDYQTAYGRGLSEAKAILDNIKFEYESAHSAEEAPVGVQIAARPAAMPESSFYFVAHEFSAGQLDDLRIAIQEALRESGLQPYFADKEVVEGQILLSKILPKIAESRFGIYDVSNPEKPNVFIELGAAIALDCPYYIIARRGTTIPSDLQGLDRIEYQSFEDLKKQLRGKIKL